VDFVESFVGFDRSVEVDKEGSPKTIVGIEGIGTITPSPFGKECTGPCFCFSLHEGKEAYDSVFVDREVGSIRAVVEKEFEFREESLSIVPLVVLFGLLELGRLGSSRRFLPLGRSMSYGRMFGSFETRSMESWEMY
jgi:hypothetical protein